MGSPATISRTWYDTLIDDSGSGTDGSVIDKADFDAILDAVDAILSGCNGDVVFTNGVGIRRNADNGYLTVSGGSADDETHGAVLTLGGNVHGTLPGYARLEIGNVAGAKFLVERGTNVSTFELAGSDGKATLTSSAGDGWEFNSTAANGGNLRLLNSGSVKTALGSRLQITGSGSAADSCLASVGNTYLWPQGGSVVPHSSEAYALGNASSLWASVNAAQVGIKDGITAPSTVAGLAQIYVDAADGDLKVKFGDGTVKTLATDT